MTPTAAAGTVRPMTDPARLRLVLELVRGSDPIEGSLTDPTGVGRPFRGWLGLASALEAVSDPKPTVPQEDPR